MILDSIENSDLYTFQNPRIAKGLEYIKNTDLAAITPGKYELAEGLTAIISEYDTKNEADCKLESHRKYIDIQYLISGEEYIGYAPLSNQVALADYDDEKDLIFYNKSEASLTKLETGIFAIYFPTDLHQPCVKYKTSSSVKKLVIKVLV